MPIKIPQSKPTLNKADTQAIPAIIQSLQLAQGKQVELFERKVARFQKKLHRQRSITKQAEVNRD